MSREHKDKDYRCADKNKPANNPYSDGKSRLVAWRLPCQFGRERVRLSFHIYMTVGRHKGNTAKTGSPDSFVKKKSPCFRAVFLPAIQFMERTFWIERFIEVRFQDCLFSMLPEHTHGLDSIIPADR